MLALAEIEQGHHGGLFVLWRVTFEDFGNEFFIDGVELERYGRIVDRAISMLRGMVLMDGDQVVGGH